MSAPTRFASLTGPLLGLYLPLPFHDDVTNRVALNSSSIAQLWCSIYSRSQAQECVEKYGGMLLPDGFERKLDFDSHEVSLTINARDEMRGTLSAIETRLLRGGTE